MRWCGISEKAARVQARGASPVLGDLTEPASYADAAAAADGVVLTAFEDSPRGVAARCGGASTRCWRRPVEPGRFVIYTSGIWILGSAPARSTRARR